MFNKFSSFVVKHQVVLKYIGVSMAATGTGGVAGINTYIKWSEYKNSVDLKIKQEDANKLIADAKIEALENKLKMSQSKELINMLYDLQKDQDNPIHLHLYFNQNDSQLRVDLIGNNDSLLQEGNIDLNGDLQ